MIIIPQLFDGRLNLSAYSYQDRELNILTTFLIANAFDYSVQNLRNDRADRKGILFTIAGFLQIQRIEKVLGVRFGGVGKDTKVGFDPVDGGTSFRCIRLKGQPWENGCVDIVASDGSAAFIKCSLVANDLNWFGADSEEGSCR